MTDDDSTASNRERAQAAASNARLSGRRRIRSAAAWGAVGGLSFLVLHQAYLLLGGSFSSIPVVAAVAIAVALVAGVVSYVVEPRLLERTTE